MEGVECGVMREDLRSTSNCPRRSFPDQVLFLVTLESRSDPMAHFRSPVACSALFPVLIRRELRNRFCVNLRRNRRAMSISSPSRHSCEG